MMTTADESGNGPEQRVPLFSVVNLILLALCLGVLAAIVSAGAKTGSLALLLVSVVIGVVLMPVVFVVGFYAFGMSVALLLLVFSEEAEVTGRLAQVRTVLRWAVAAAAMVWIGLALPYLWKASSLRALGDAALLGQFLPVSALLMLALPWLHQRVRRRQKAAEPPVADRPPDG